MAHQVNMLKGQPVMFFSVLQL